MAVSGNFDTLFFRNGVPLIDENTPFKPLNMLAVNESSIIQGYNFYEYQQACGIQDTSTILVNVSTSINTNISTIQGRTLSSITTLTSNINFIGKIYTSSIEYPQNVDFMSTGFNNAYSGKILTPIIPLGEKLSHLINSHRFNVHVDFQYSLYLSTPTSNFTWINTLGSLNTLDDPILLFGNKGSSNITRVGNNTYTTLNTSLVFSPTVTQMPANISNFQLQINLNSTINAISPLSPYFDIYIPGSINFKITLTPSF
jgi:hypothetical protein